MKVTARDCFKILGEYWDSTSPLQRLPYKEEARKNGYVYAVRMTREEEDAAYAEFSQKVELTNA